jgi:hypothetical protein
MAVEVRQLRPQAWELRLTVGAAGPAVFAYLLDFGRHPEWEHELRAVALTHGRPSAVGATYVKTYGERPAGFLRRMFSSPLRVTCRITAVDPPGHLAWKQHMSHRSSGPSSFQDVDVVISPHGSGSQLVVTRDLVGTEGMSADLVARFSTRLGDVLSALPPDGVGPGVRPGAGDLVRRALDGHPSRGPGPTSLERLQVRLGG